MFVSCEERMAGLLLVKIGSGGWASGWMMGGLVGGGNLASSEGLAGVLIVGVESWFIGS